MSPKAVAQVSGMVVAVDEVKACGNRHGQTRAGDRDVRQPGPVDGKCHHPVPGRESVHPSPRAWMVPPTSMPRDERPPR